MDAGQPPVRRVRWEKGGGCSYTLTSDTVGVGVTFAQRHTPTSPVARGVLLHELGHRHLRHRHHIVTAAVTVTGTVFAAAGGAAAGVSAVHGPAGFVVLAMGVLLGWILGYGLARRTLAATTKRWEHEADDYATDLCAEDSLAALKTYRTLTGAEHWLSTHPDPDDRIARQRSRHPTA